MLNKSEGLGEKAGSWVGWLFIVACSKVLQDALTQARNGSSEIKGRREDTFAKTSSLILKPITKLMENHN